MNQGLKARSIPGWKDPRRRSQVWFVLNMAIVGRPREAGMTITKQMSTKGAALVKSCCAAPSALIPPLILFPALRGCPTVVEPPKGATQQSPGRKRLSNGHGL
jgi:hypothetical protein